jgi:hypothetical protein
MTITYNGQIVRLIRDTSIGETFFAKINSYTPSTDCLHYNTHIAHPSPTQFRSAGKPYLRIKRTGQDDWNIKRFDPPYPTLHQALEDAAELKGKVPRIKCVKDALAIGLKQAKELVEEHFRDSGQGPPTQPKTCELQLPQCTGTATHQLDWETDILDYALEAGGRCYSTTARVCQPCLSDTLEGIDGAKLWRARWRKIHARTPIQLCRHAGSDDAPPWNQPMPLSPKWLEYWQNLSPRELYHNPGGEYHGNTFSVIEPIFDARFLAARDQREMPAFQIRIHDTKFSTIIAFPREIFKECESWGAPATGNVLEERRNRTTQPEIELPPIPHGECPASIAAENALNSIAEGWPATKENEIGALAGDVDDTIAHLTKWKMDCLALWPKRDQTLGLSPRTADRIVSELALDSKLYRQIYLAARLLVEMGHGCAVYKESSHQISYWSINNHSFAIKHQL